MENKRHKVEDRLVILHSIKEQDGLVSNAKVWAAMNKSQRTMPKSKDKSDFATNVGFAVKSSKDAELLAGQQEYEFVPLDKTARRNVELQKRVWAYHWLASRTDKHLSRVIPSSTTNGSGFLYEGLKTTFKKIKVPRLEKDGRITYKEDIVKDYDGVYCEYVPFRNFYIDGTDIDSSNEAIWIKLWDRESYIKEHELNPNYKNISTIPSGKEFTFVELADDPKGEQDDENVLVEMRYYNKAEDEMIILANGVEVYSSPIPYTHKELPFCLFVDYQVEDRLYGMGEYELLEEDIKYKDAVRSLKIDVIKSQMGITIIEDDIDFDESTFEFGPDRFMRVSSSEGIKHFSPSISTQSIDGLENQIDNDIIVKTGIDFKSQLLSPNETATRTASKSQSSKKRVNLNLKINGYSFYERLARLRLSNIQLLHSRGTLEIPVKGGNITKDGTFEPLNGGYGTFTVTPDIVKGKFNLVPITESSLGITAEREKARAIQAVQLLGSLVKKDGTPVFPGESIGRFLADRLEYDFEELSGELTSGLDAKSILDQLDSEDKGISSNPSDPSSPEFIPGAQRSGAGGGVPTLSGQSNISSADVIE